MTKVSTVQFTVNNLASKTSGELIDLDSLFNHQENSVDIVRFLDQLNYDAPQHVIDAILEQAAS